MNDKLPDLPLEPDDRLGLDEERVICGGCGEPDLVRRTVSGRSVLVYPETGRVHYCQHTEEWA